jgi:formimidoylglutamate deiminase
VTGGQGKALRCKGLWDGRGWRHDVTVRLDADGCVAGFEEGAAPAAEAVDGYVLPGFPNAHSHAFQYAMAGLAEHLPAGAAQDDFWSWREAMYGLAGRIDPEAMEAVAAQLYAEMLRHGITAVAEFHYLHHDPQGRPYAALAEMGARLMAAAETAGIELTLLPVLYQRGGFGKPATPGQRRFLSATRDDYLRLVEASRAAARGRTDVRVGLAVHSLRAAATDDALEILGQRGAGPVHLHIAEQRKEVDDCLAQLGARPVAWLLDHADVDERMHLVHATHVTDEETRRLAATRAHVVLCPSTEGNLGDGFFPLAEYHAAGGRYAIGTDSHIGLSPLEELRWIDYGQRLRSERRNVVCRSPGDDSGEQIYLRTWTAGRAALGDASPVPFAVGAAFDAVVVDPEHPVVLGKPAARRLSAIVYGGDAALVRGVMRRGTWVVEGGRHARHDAIRKAFARAVARIG